MLKKSKVAKNLKVAGKLPSNLWLSLPWCGFIYEEKAIQSLCV